MSKTETINEVTELPGYIRELFYNIAVREGFSDISIIPSVGSNYGEGFMGILSRVTIQGIRNGQSDELILMLKMPPSSPARRALFNSKDIFEREIYMYKVVLPAFLQFQNEKGLTAEDGFYAFPKCYETICDMENEIFAIVMDDLKAQGYSLWNKSNVINKEHVKFVMEELGKFHAISFAIRDQKPELFAQFEELDDIFLRIAHKSKETMIEFQNVSMNKAIASLHPSETIAIGKIQTIKSNFLDVLAVCVSKNEAAPFYVINHGDFWSNNMMYLYNGDKRPQGVYFLDWQVSRVGSPALDVVHFLFSTTDKTQRDAHYDEFINIYYNSLANTLRKIGSDPEKLFTKNDLNEQLKQFGKFALLLCPMLLQMITADPEDTPNMDEIAENIAKDATDVGMTFTQNSIDAFNRRMSDVIRDVIAFGYY